jgi:four helix bundle protein
MTEIPMTKTRFDLEDRTYVFARNVTLFSQTIPRTVSNIEYLKQVIRASGSVGANYIEANESLSKKDFLLRIKICRKEAKETAYWLRLLVETNNLLDNQPGITLINEALELKKIFSAILINSK